MKKPIWFYLCLLSAVVFGSCASRPPPTVPEIIGETVITRAAAHIPPSILTPVEKLLARIKQNEADILKYFILDENGQIIVMANFQDETGNYKVTYDLEGAKALGGSVYEVGFILYEEKTETRLEDSLIWKPLAGNAGILLSFDDDYFESWEKHMDLFDKYEAKVTFFIQGRFDPFSVKAMNRGHDIGYHSLSHPDLRGITRTEFIKETIEAAELFRREGVPISSFAFPFGFSQPWMFEILFPSFPILRGYGVTFRLYNKDKIISAFISSRAIDNTVIRGEENFDRIIRIMLKTVKFLDEDWVLPLTSHDISDIAWGITPRRLEFLLSLAADLRLRFYRFSDFVL